LAMIYVDSRISPRSSFANTRAAAISQKWLATTTAISRACQFAIRLFWLFSFVYCHFSQFVVVIDVVLSINMRWAALYHLICHH
jgi:hypothetical protein